MPPVVTVAQIAALASITAAIITCVVAYLSARKNAAEQLKLEALKASTQADLEKLKSELAAGSADKSARRSYEFDALKRLYQEVEPLLFQLHENSSGAINRIRNISRASRDGSLKEWLGSDDRYYLRSTVHSLLAPLAVVHILRERITLLDLSLDPRIERQYELGKALNRSFSRDFWFAQQEPEISYDPNGVHTDEASTLQGVYAGNLQRAVARLVISDGDRKRAKTFGEFTSEWDDPSSGAGDDLLAVVEPLLGFTPEERPILWRILVAQLLLHRAIRLQRTPHLSADEVLEKASLSDAENAEFSPVAGDAPDRATLAALSAGRVFLLEALGPRA